MTMATEISELWDTSPIIWQNYTDSSNDPAASIFRVDEKAEFIKYISIQGQGERVQNY